MRSWQCAPVISLLVFQQPARIAVANHKRRCLPAPTKDIKAVKHASQVNRVDSEKLFVSFNFPLLLEPFGKRISLGSTPAIHNDAYTTIWLKTFRSRLKLHLKRVFIQLYLSLMNKCWKEIGKVTALAFVETGAYVSLMSTKNAEFHKTAAESEQFGGKAVFVSADAINEDQLNEGVKRCLLIQMNQKQTFLG